MKRYNFKAKVRRIVDDTVLLTVHAEDKSAAYEHMNIAINGGFTQSVPYCYLSGRDFISTEVLSVVDTDIPKKVA